MIFHQPVNSQSNHSYNARIYQFENWEPHFHKNFELVYVISGEVVCTANDKTELVKTNEFVIFLSNEIHSITPIEDAVYWVGVFSGDFVHSFEKHTKNKKGNKLNFCCEDSILQYLKSNLITEEMPPVYILKSCLYAVCNEYISQVKLTEHNNKTFALMNTLIDFISENYKNKISLKDASKRLGYNYHYLSKKFNKTFSMSFIEYLNSYRLEKALEMLTETDMNITDIAFESGFQSIRSFNEIFKQRTGTTPIKYRSEQK